ncbi:MAG: carbohydrate ABC transporter permease [Aggregatilineales bacterium]
MALASTDISTQINRKSWLLSRLGLQISVFQIGLTLIVVALLLFTLVPLLYMVTTSFKEPIEIRRSGAFLPETATDINWVRAYRNVPVHIYLGNSTLVALGSALLAVAVGLPISYVIARFHFGGNLLKNWILGTYITPPIVISIPVFLMFRTVGLIDSKLGLAIVHGVAALPVAVWLLENFIRKVPRDIDEAAWIDGASYWGTLFRIIFPVILPGLIATFIICIILSWNEFLFALILTYTRNAQTFPIGISNYIGEHGQQFGEMSAAALGGLVPIYLLAFFFQRYLVQGLSSGTVK